MKFKEIKKRSLGILKRRKASEPSKGEKAIMLFLDSERLGYIREYFFKDLYNRKTGQLLYFDFYIREFNLCIEFDGKQHYSKDKSSNEVANDFLKSAYCVKNKISLLRIKFTDLDNVEKIICQKIDKINPI